MSCKTDDDELNEASVAAQIEHQFGWVVDMNDLMVKRSTIDYTFYTTDDKLLGYGELKTRTIASDAYPTGLVSKNKIDRLCQLSEEFGVKTVMLFLYTDGLYWVSAQQLAQGEPGIVTRRKPRANGKRAYTDLGHDGYYFPREWLQPIDALGAYIG